MTTRITTLALIAVVSFTPLACVQKDSPLPFEGRTISSIDVRFRGSGHHRPVTAEQIKAILGSKPGTTLTVEQIDDDEEALHQSGLIDDCRFLVEWDGEQVRLFAEVTLEGDAPIH